jgi:hypothetical protein
VNDFLIWLFTVAYPIGCGVICTLGLIFIYCDNRGI